MTLIPEMSLRLDDVIKTRLMSQTSSATLIQCHDINERKCSTNKSEYYVTTNPMDAVSTIQDAVSTIQYKTHDDGLTMMTLIASCLLISLAEFSLQGYAPPVVRTAAPEPVCRKVPKKVYEEVPKTIYDTVSWRECHDFADTVCADIQDQKCPVSQKPAQESVSRQECSSQSTGPFLKFPVNLFRCQGDLAEMSLNSEKSRDPFDAVKIRVLTQASSATISSMCLDVNERKCMTKAPWECDIPKQVPVTNFTYNTVKRRQCKDVADIVCANGNERKCQIAQRQNKTQYKRQRQVVSEVPKSSSFNFKSKSRSIKSMQHFQ